MKKTITAWLLGTVSVVAFGLWRYSQPPLPRAHVALLYDRSESMPRSCEALVALGKRALTLPHVRDGSTLALFATGDRGTGFEPVLLTTYSLPVTRLATESNKRLTERQQVFLIDLRQRCGALRSTRVSPIVQAITEVLAHLRSLGDNSTVRYLLARTDLQENIEPTVMKALARTAGVPSAIGISNDGVETILCGSAEIVDQRARRSVERVREVWTGLFTQPDLLQFEPYCAQLPNPLEATK